MLQTTTSTEHPTSDPPIARIEAILVKTKSLRNLNCDVNFWITVEMCASSIVTLTFIPFMWENGLEGRW